METTFEALIAPLQEYLKKHSESIDKTADSRKLKFKDFTLIMVFAYIMGIPSLRKLSDKIAISDTAKKLGIKFFAWTTIRDGFTRFCYSHFLLLYQSVLKNTELIRINSIDELGLISLVDGSIFPTIANMCWAEYKKNKRAIRLHVEFSLNQMIPLEFVGQKANSSERAFLKSIVTKAVTYIADRGYFSFDLAAYIVTSYAFFIFRIKSNMKYEVGKALNVTGKIPVCLENVTDELILFTNDPHQKVYRLITFTVDGNEFILCTNRLDLSTLQIIMLYAYRWQIELLFKFIKRVINGIHLFNHSENGVNIQFCLLMIMSVLYLNLRQFCKITTENVKKTADFKISQPSNIEHFNISQGCSPDKWVNSINRVFKDLWKISSYWLENLKELLCKPFDNQVIRLLSAP